MNIQGEAGGSRHLQKPFVLPQLLSKAEVLPAGPLQTPVCGAPCVPDTEIGAVLSLS